MTTFGEVNWSDDIFTGDKKQTNSKDLFLRLDEGSNEMRLITQPFQYLVHKVKRDPNNPKDFGQKVNCSAIHGKCPVCETGDKAKPRWFLGVISRKTESFKILDISYAVFSQIRKLARNTKHWGDPTKYDIDIIVDKAGGATGYYSVQGISKNPLSASDQKIKDDVDLEDLKRRVTPPTPEYVQSRLEKIQGGEGSVKSAVADQKSTTKVSMTDDGDDMEDAFPAYNAQ